MTNVARSISMANTVKVVVSKMAAYMPLHTRNPIMSSRLFYRWYFLGEKSTKCRDIKKHDKIPHVFIYVQSRKLSSNYLSFLCIFYSLKRNVFFCCSSHEWFIYNTVLLANRCKIHISIWSQYDLYKPRIGFDTWYIRSNSAKYSVTLVFFSQRYFLKMICKICIFGRITLVGQDCQHFQIKLQHKQCMVGKKIMLICS